MMRSRKPCSIHKSTSGMAIVELALSIPFLLLTLVAIIYFGRAFLIMQTCSLAAQEGAKLAARVPELSNPATRDYVRGFTAGGNAVNPDSVIYGTMGGARLLSQGENGDLPSGARVRILPWDDGDSYTGTIKVVVEYPFSLLINPFTGRSAGETSSIAIAMQAEDSNPIAFPDMVIRESATVSSQIYQN